MLLKQGPSAPRPRRRIGRPVAARIRYHRHGSVPTCANTARDLRGRVRRASCPGCCPPHWRDARASQAGHALPGPDLEVRLAAVQAEQDQGFLAFLQALAGRLVGSHDEHADSAELEWVGKVFAVQGEDLFDGPQDGSGDEGRTVRALLDLASKQAVAGLGIAPSVSQTMLHRVGTNHRLAPSMKTEGCTPSLEVRAK